jgi:hypothetical protein
MDIEYLKYVYKVTVNNIYRLKVLGFEMPAFDLGPQTNTIMETCNYIVDNFEPEEFDSVVENMFTQSINETNIFHQIDEIWSKNR